MRQYFCLLCEGLVFKKNRIMCSSCFNRFKSSKVRKRQEKGINHYYLFSWSKKNDFFYRRLVYFLKNKSEDYFIQLAELFSYDKDPDLRKLLVSSNVVEYVCPKSSDHKSQSDTRNKAHNSTYNHAQSLSKALVKLYGSKRVLCMSALNTGFQKRKKSRKERYEFQDSFYSSLESESTKEASSWIFVDDVFVTGATCYKVSRQKGSSPQGVLSLFYREKEF